MYKCQSTIQILKGDLIMNKTTRNMTLSAMFIALALVLPFFTGQIPQIGSMLLPMHFPVFLTGLICGWQYGLTVGAIVPILRHLMFGMPPMLTAIAMAFELATYGLVAGYIYTRVKKQTVTTIYTSLLSAMVIGRIVWGIVQIIILNFTGSAFTVQMFMAGALLNAIPGIIAQLVIVPIIMIALDKAKIIKFKNV